MLWLARWRGSTDEVEAPLTRKTDQTTAVAGLVLAVSCRNDSWLAPAAASTYALLEISMCDALLS